MKRLKNFINKYPFIRKRMIWGKRVIFPLSNPFVIFKYLSFYQDLRSFKKMEGKASVEDWYPCLFDKRSTTPYDPYYFFQGVWITGKLLHKKAEEHVDVGSDIKVVGILTNFCPVTFIDIRPLEVKLKNLSSKAGSIIKMPFKDNSVKSLSCMHVIEHIGLGRYGDPIDPNGSTKACKELKRVLAYSGDMYITVPIGRNRVCFNGHRVFSPNVFRGYFSDLSLVSFSVVDDEGEFHTTANLEGWEQLDAGLGLFHFKKEMVTND